MANEKITQQTADATPTSDDLVITVNAPGTTPANRKVTLANLGKGLDAGVIPNTPAGSIAATDIQGAIDELDSEKAATSHTHTESDITDLGTYLTAAGTATLTNKSMALGTNTVTGTAAQFDSAVTDANFAYVAKTATLTNKTLNLANNTLTGTKAEFEAAVSDGTPVFEAETATLTNKTLNLTSNTLVTTVAQLNTAISDATLSGNNTGDESAASDTVAGIVELATIAETNTGTDTTRAVTPDGLDGWTGSAQIATVGTVTSGNVDAVVSAASTSTAGKIEIATSAETLAVTSDVLAVTPLKAQLLIDSNEITFAASRILGAKAAGDTAYTAMTTAQLKTLTGYMTAIADDTSSPTLGANLDVGGFEIISSSNGDIVLNPNGTGDVGIGNFTFDGDQTVGAGQDNYVMTYDNGTGLVSLEAQAGGGDALTSNPLSQFAATTSAQLAGVISDETGSGALVFGTSPTLVTPALGTPASGVLTNTTGYPGDSSLTTVGTVTSGNVDALVVGTTITSKTELASGLATTDELLVSDAGTIKRMDIAVLNDAAHTLQNKTLAATTLSGTLSGGDNVVQAVVHQDYVIQSNTPTATTAVITLSYSSGPDFAFQLATAVTSFAFSNTPASGDLAKISMRIQQHASAAKTCAFGTAVGPFQWSGGTTATVTATTSAYDEYVLWSRTGFDTCTNIFIAAVGQNFS